MLLLFIQKFLRPCEFDQDDTWATALDEQARGDSEGATMLAAGEALRTPCRAGRRQPCVMMAYTCACVVIWDMFMAHHECTRFYEGVQIDFGMCVHLLDFVVICC